LRAFQERDWERLIAQVASGDVVPVLGAEMVVVSDGAGASRPVEEYLRHELGTYFGDAGTASSVSLRRLCSDVLRRQGVHQDDCHYQAWDLLSRTAPAPESPLQQLAEISDFNLFVSTTPDDFLRQALLAARGAGPLELVYGPQRRLVDLPDEEQPATILYKLLGTASHRPDYVLSEEDILRFVTRLQQPDYQPVRLLEKLRASKLLFLGSSFPDWLARFFFYSTQGEPILNGRCRAIVADQQTATDEALVAFLERAGAQVWSGGDAAAFTTELHRRWTERQRSRPSQPTVALPPAPEAPKDALFISYASEDLAAATRVAEALRAKGLPVWFDKQRLESGDEYWNRIRLSIDNARFFLPLLSQHTQVEQKRVFRAEWEYAVEQQKKWFGMDYLIPITLDGSVDYHDPLIPSPFRERHWESAPDGELSPAFLESIHRRFRAYRSGRTGVRADG
jgi:hypothetical protein